MKQWLGKVVGLLFLGIVSPLLLSESAEDAIPPHLGPWKEWVLQGYDSQLCPAAYNQADHHFCFWLPRVTLTLQEDKGAFTQEVVNEAEGWVPLVGDRDHWPQAVTVNGQLFPVMTYQGAPALLLSKGHYQIAGQFSWKELPQVLQTPVMSGVCEVQVNGQRLSPEARDARGRLWLKQSAVGNQEALLNLKVFRLLQDRIPMEEITLLRLQVSGTMREVVLGPVLSPHAFPLSLESPLPAQLEADGRLRLQVTAGDWQIQLKSRYQGLQHHLPWIARDPPWPVEEIWIFQSDPELRMVTTQGGVPLDPKQTDIPEKWQSSPAFLMRKGDMLSLTEQHRGASAKQDHLQLNRQMWLDFSGKGWVIQDQLVGALEQHWRLFQKPPFLLGRVMIDDAPQVITQLHSKEPGGVEVRQGQLQLVALSQVLQPVFRLPAAGWNTAVDQINTTLFLPAGWKLIATKGVERADQTWIAQWTLWDLFLVLVLAIAIGKCFGLRWGWVALGTLALICQEKGAPLYSWIGLLVAIVLLRALPSGRLRKGIQFYGILSLLGVGVIALPFIVEQARSALYPQLSLYGVTQSGLLGQPRGALELATSALNAPLVDRVFKQAVTPEPEKPQEIAYDPAWKAQTGPGEPRWQWNASLLQWESPVPPDHTFRLWVLSRAVVSFLKLLAIGGLLALLYRFCCVWHPSLRAPLKTLLKSVGVLCLIPGAPTDAFADIPDPALLEALRTRLLMPAPCFPTCATISEMIIGTKADRLTFEMTVACAARVAVPLPTVQGQSASFKVRADGQEAIVMRDQDQQLWIQLEKGVHQVEMSGWLVDHQWTVVHTPLKPAHVTFLAEGWQVTGIVGGQLQGDSFSLARAKQEKQSELFPPFVTLTRVIRLGLEWEVHSVLQRIAPPTGSIVLSLPMLPQETVLSKELVVQGQTITASLPANQSRLEWQSRLPVQSPLTLQATDNLNVKEIWQLDAMSQWHCTWQGIPPVRQQDPDQHRWLPTWEPWPKETVTLQMTKPQALAGATLTLEEGRLTVDPGYSLTKGQLKLATRSSEGGSYRLQLPPDVSVQEVQVGGVNQPARQQDGELTVILSPGEQEIVISWQKPQGIRTFYRTLLIDCHQILSNLSITLRVPPNRWILQVGGPEIGPAVVVWGVLLVLWIVSFALGKSKLTPLHTWEWGVLVLGMIFAAPVALVITAVWFIAMKQRKQWHPSTIRYFNWMQMGLVLLTVVFLGSLVSSVVQGLLGTPDMQLQSPSVLGRGEASQLQWFQDKAKGIFPQAWVFSVPLAAYRIAMLAWALWLAWRLVTWLQWGWHCFSRGGYWQSKAS